MNERMTELYAKACLDARDKHFEDKDVSAFITCMAENFAELIVEECRYVMDCNKGGDQNPAWNQALWETSEKIKQHFGVEE